MTKTTRLAHLINALAALGFSDAEIKRLRRIQSTLHRWSEAECNGEIERNDAGEPVRFLKDWAGDRCGCYKVPDREAGALKRLAAIMAAHPDLWSYHQTDPRGCALYVGRLLDLKTDDNQIVAKAESWGAIFSEDEEGMRVEDGKQAVGFFDTQEDAARAYLKLRGASIPARDLLPLDQHYMRGVAVY